MTERRVSSDRLAAVCAGAAAGRGHVHCGLGVGVRGPSVAARLSPGGGRGPGGGWSQAGTRTIANIHRTPRAWYRYRVHQDGAGTFLYVTLNTGIWDCKNSFLTWNTRTKQTRGCDTRLGQYEHGFYEFSNFLQPTPIIKTPHCTEESLSTMNWYNTMSIFPSLQKHDNSFNFPCSVWVQHIKYQSVIVSY